MSIICESQTESQIAQPVLRHPEIAVGVAHIVVHIGPRAAASYAELATVGALRIAGFVETPFLPVPHSVIVHPLLKGFAGGHIVGHTLVFRHQPQVVVVLIPVAAPFPHIARHVVQPQLVGHQPAHHMGRVAAVHLRPAHLHCVITSSKEIAARLPAASCRIFPLRLGGQSEAIACDAVQPADEFLHLDIRHLFHRQVVALEIGRIVAHDGRPQLLGHLVSTQIIVRKSDTMHRHLIILADMPVLPLAAHHKRASLHIHHVELAVPHNK